MDLNFTLALSVVAIVLVVLTWQKLGNGGSGK